MIISYHYHTIIDTHSVLNRKSLFVIKVTYNLKQIKYKLILNDLVMIKYYLEL